MADLYSRLKRIKAGRTAAKSSETGAPEDSVERELGGRAGEGAGEGTPSAVDSATPVLSPEWHEVGPMVYVRDTVEAAAVPPSLVRDGGEVESRLLGRRVDLGSLRFMDTETTGLSGGAGTTVFLVGSGSLENDVLTVRQTLLVDFPGEPDFLEHVARSLASDVWVSYNGKAFDARLLESRFLMNGIPPLAAEQLDLLYWSRRMWRSALGSCSLGNVEREILDRGRTDDIPGVEIPERYFRFLRGGDGSELEEVFEHHRLDIVSLAHLFFRLERILRDPVGAADTDPCLDCYRLGRWLLPTDEAVGADLLERAVMGESRDSAVRAALVLSRRYRRGSRSEDALRVLSSVEAEQSVAVLVEMAKMFEHDLREPERARALIAAYLSADAHRRPRPALAPRMQAALRYRLDRLERKVLAGTKADS